MRCGRYELPCLWQCLFTGGFREATLVGYMRRALRDPVMHALTTCRCSHLPLKSFAACQVSCPVLSASACLLLQYEFVVMSELIKQGHPDASRKV